MVTFNINIGRKETVFFVAFFVVILGVGVVIAYVDTPNPGHGADEIAVMINGTETSLQNAVSILEGSISSLKIVVSGLGESGVTIYTNYASCNWNRDSCTAIASCNAGDSAISGGGYVSQYGSLTDRPSGTSSWSCTGGSGGSGGLTCYVACRHIG